MKLRNLDPHFVRYDVRIEEYSVIVGDHATWRERGCPSKIVTGPRVYHCHEDSFEKAHGITFLCPKCFRDNDGAIGTHCVNIAFDGRAIPDEEGISLLSNGTQVRWNASGSSLDDLSTTPSILLIGGCAWHGYITNGEVSIL